MKHQPESQLPNQTSHLPDFKGKEKEIYDAIVLAILNNRKLCIYTRGTNKHIYYKTRPLLLGYYKEKQIAVNGLLWLMIYIEEKNFTHDLQQHEDMNPKNIAFEWIEKAEVLEESFKMPPNPNDKSTQKFKSYIIISE
jgi:hypothetical protein